MRLLMIIAAVLLATACSPTNNTDDPTKLDDAALYACEDLVSGYKTAVSRQARMNLADKVNEWAPRSQTNRIADMGVVLVRGAEATDAAWQLAADSFSQACIDAGYGK